MDRFRQDIFLAAGLRTPLVSGGGALSNYDAISLSVPVVQAMAEQLPDQRPDLILWGTVIPATEDGAISPGKFGLTRSLTRPFLPSRWCLLAQRALRACSQRRA